MNEFVTFEFLGSFTGMVVVLGIIVQFTKGLVKRYLMDGIVQIYTFVWALIIVGIVYWCQGIFDGLAIRDLVAAGLQMLINAMVVALSAIGEYEIIAHRKPAIKKNVE